MYNPVPAFGLLCLNSTLSAVAAIHKSQIGTSCLYRLQINRQTLSDIVIVFNKVGGGFSGV